MKSVSSKFTNLLAINKECTRQNVFSTFWEQCEPQILANRNFFAKFTYTYVCM